MHKLLILFIAVSVGCVFGQNFTTIETKDNGLSIVEPIGWNKTNASGAIEFALTLNDQYPLTLVCVKEKGRVEEVIGKLKQALPKGATVKQATFKSATGNAGVALVVEKPLEKAGSVVFQYYYIFQGHGVCYALIGTSGACPANGGPEPIFNAIATTVKIK